MLYWSIILFICIIALVISLIAFRKSDWDSISWGCSAIVSIAAALIIVLVMLTTVCEYRSFLASFEVQRIIATQIHQPSDNSLFYTADMINANQKLAEMQGSKKAWGGWSMYPDSVMDITPIGLEN